MITEKIRKKLHEICQDDQKAYDALLDLLKYEDSEKSQKKNHCNEVVEKYASEVKDNEN